MNWLISSESESTDILSSAFLGIAYYIFDDAARLQNE